MRPRAGLAAGVVATLSLGLAPGGAPAVESAAPAAAKRPALRLAVVPAGRRVLLTGNAVRVVVELRTAKRVRLIATGAVVGEPRTRAVMGGPRRVSRGKGGRAGRRIVPLRLTGAGRRNFGRCAAVQVTVTATGAGIRGRATKRFRFPRPCVPAGTAPPARTPSSGGDSPSRPGDNRPGSNRPGGNRPGTTPPGTTPPGTTTPAPEKPSYFVGIASRSINPDEALIETNKVFLGGYGIGGGGAVSSGRWATGILGDGASTRAITISDGKRTLALADIEVQGWFVANRDADYGLVDLRRAVAARTGGAIKPSQVIAQSDHTHSGADAIGVWGGVPLEFRKYMFDQTVDAVVAAFEASRSGRLFYGAVDGRDLLSNQFDYDTANQAMDSEVRVLQARDSQGRTFGTLLNFSAHTTVLGSGNKKVSGDWVQAANPLLEQRFGGRAMTVVGTLGRTQPADRGCSTPGLQGDAENLCTIEDYARRVVDRAAQAVSAAKAIPGDPLVDARSYLIRDVGSNPLLLGLLYAGSAPGVGIPINRAITPPWQTGNVIGTTTTSARIGDVLLSAMPGEAYPQMPLKVRAIASGLRGYMTAGLANDQLGYLIAPYESYPEPIRRSFFNQRGDEVQQCQNEPPKKPEDVPGCVVSPIDNDNYFFNVSHTMGERVTCSLLRGAGELLGKGMAYWTSYERCPTFANDAATAPGSDIP